jgi:hypothetical protein
MSGKKPVHFTDAISPEDPTNAMVNVDRGQPGLDSVGLPSWSEIPYRGLNNDVG